MRVTRVRHYILRDFQGKNLVVSGHIASDVAGINPFIERLESMGLSITRVSGL
jgi:hypothetical protein